MKKVFPYILIAFLLIITLWLQYDGSEGANTPNASPSKSTSSSNPSTSNNKAGSSKNTTTPINRNRGFDRRISYLEYTAHARCRMQCRKISQKEVEEMMKEGTINYKKSDVNAKPCPTYAVEGITSDQQKVRIVFAQCDHTTKVVTVIDLNHDYPCDCPGDKKK